ncbi:MAG: hypothetical protein GY928_34615 [Colwellia sp.]|nr:hypothetical protein [Colwellia sp.]
MEHQHEAGAKPGLFCKNFAMMLIYLLVGVVFVCDGGDDDDGADDAVLCLEFLVMWCGVVMMSW